MWYSTPANVLETSYEKSLGEDLQAFRGCGSDLLITVIESS